MPGGLKGIVAAGMALLASSHLAEAAIIFDQSATTGVAYISQDYPDFPTFSTAGYDDFSLLTATDIDIFTVFGTDFGNAALNVAVTASIYADAAGFPGAALSTVSGSQVGSDLVFDFGSLVLGPGSYWISAVVTRPFANGGDQWYWNEHSPASGSESLFWNPGGGYGYGTGIVTHTTVSGNPNDSSWTLSGNAVASLPEPSPLALALLGVCGIGGLFGATIRRRSSAT